jgi:signal peptidase I
MIIGKGLRKLIRRIIRDWAVPTGCGLLFLFLLKCVFFFGYVPSASMEPVIRENSFIIGIRVTSGLEAGDVVVFERGGRLMVKRIAGVPGGTVYSGGKLLAVPEGRYFVLGDNSGSSADSRHWGDPFVPAESIIAKIWCKGTD